MSASLARVREGGKEARRARGIGVELGAELLAHVLLLVDSQPRIHHDEEGEHQQRQQRRPLQQKAEKDRHEGHILRVPNPGVWAAHGKLGVPLRVVEHRPGARQKPEAAPDEDVARDMKRAEVRVAPRNSS